MKQTVVARRLRTTIGAKHLEVESVAWASKRNIHTHHGAILVLVLVCDDGDDDGDGDGQDRRHRAALGIGRSAARQGIGVRLSIVGLSVVLYRSTKLI